MLSHFYKNKTLKGKQHLTINDNKVWPILLAPGRVSDLPELAISTVQLWIQINPPTNGLWGISENLKN